MIEKNLRLSLGRLYHGSLNPYNQHDEIIVSTKSQTRKGSIPDRNYTEDEIYTKLNELSRQYYHLDEGLTRHKNRYKELLHLCFPEFELCFKDGKIYNLTALNFIKEFPHAYIIKKKRVDALAYIWQIQMVGISTTIKEKLILLRSMHIILIQA